MCKHFTRRFTPSPTKQFVWLVLVGENCDTQYEVSMRIPSEEYARLVLRIPKDVPVLIGRP